MEAPSTTLTIRSLVFGSLYLVNKESCFGGWGDGSTLMAEPTLGLTLPSEMYCGEQPPLRGYKTRNWKDKMSRLFYLNGRFRFFFLK